MHPTVFAGGLIMIGAFVKQIFNFRKIKLAGEELKKQETNFNTLTSLIFF